MNQKVALSLLTTVPLGIAVVVLVYTGTSSSAFPSSSTDHETSAGHYWLSTQPVEGGNAQAVEPHEPHTPDLAKTYSVSSPDESMAFWEEHGFEDVPPHPLPTLDSPYSFSDHPAGGGNAQAVEPHEPHTPDLAETYSVSSPDESMAFWEEHGFEDVPGLPIPVDDSYHHNEVAPETE